MIALSAHAQGTILAVRAQPGARKNAVLGTHDGALRVAITAPPEKGKANAAIVVLLADLLGCKAARVGILSGATARQKRFLIAGITPEELRQKLAAQIPPVLFD